jgi:hypothetical protein
MLSNKSLISLLIITVFLYVLFIYDPKTVEGFYFGQAYQPIRGYFRNYYPYGSSGVVYNPPSYSYNPNINSISSGVGPYRMNLWNKIYRTRRPFDRLGYRKPFYRLNNAPFF